MADEDNLPIDERRAALDDWREDIRRTCNGGDPRFPVNRELRMVVEKYKLPFELFDELLRGVEMDLDQDRYETLEDLDQYCHRVASVVGLLSIEIFGYRDPACREDAVHLGKALQIDKFVEMQLEMLDFVLIFKNLEEGMLIWHYWEVLH